jgi:phosphate/sulfate permease
MRPQQQQPTVIYVLNADGTPLQPMSATAGAASARGLKSIKWPMVDGVVKSWFITVPVSCAMGYAFAFLVNAIM